MHDLALCSCACVCMLLLRVIRCEFECLLEPFVWADLVLDWLAPDVRSFFFFVVERDFSCEKLNVCFGSLDLSRVFPFRVHIVSCPDRCVFERRFIPKQNRVCSWSALQVAIKLTDVLLVHDVFCPTRLILWKIFSVHACVRVRARGYSFIFEAWWVSLFNFY